MFGVGRMSRRWQGLISPLTRSIRNRFVALAVLPLVVGFPVLLLLLAGWGGATFHELLVFKVRSDLAVAETYFGRVKAEIGRSVDAVATSEALVSAQRQGGGRALEVLLAERAQSMGLDYLLLVDVHGKVLASSLLHSLSTPYPKLSLITQALQGQGRAVLDSLSPQELQQLSPALREQARIPLRSILPTTSPRDAVSEHGLVLHAAYAIPAQQQVLVGGMLLNRNIGFVDRIQHLVYPPDALPNRSQGATSLFLGDVRIATTLSLPKGGRAIGTRASAEVAEKVLARGEDWLDRAQVLADWYVSGYQPLLDSTGQRVGMLYVGFPEQPFQWAKWLALAVLLALFAIAMAAAAWVSWQVVQSVVQPLERLRRTMQQVAAGDLGARVGALPYPDELAMLAWHFDDLLARIQTQNDALTRWASALDDKVAERTRELAAANHTLMTAQQRLFKSEKLAAIGQLAAGIAHEVNNPVAVIQGNLDLMQELLGEAGSPVEPEFRLLREQVQRIRLIVAKLLQYAKPSEYSGYLQQVRPQEVFQDSLLLVQHQFNRANIAVSSEMHAKGSLLVNRYELLQVLINLMVNALQAMPDGGMLTLKSVDSVEQGVQGVRLSVCDSGRGIADEDLLKVFDPFFTSKHDGTGLGLWVCLGLVERYGGHIAATNQPEGGACFCVWLPCEPELNEGAVSPNESLMKR